jgi:rRNA processing protein Krr1/Pno1
MDQESVVLEVDPRSVHNAIVQANKDVESWEKGIVGAGDRMQKSLERMADLLIKVNDKQRSSLERLTQAVEKQAAAYGKTGVDRLVAERDRLIKKLGDEKGMINRVRAAYEQMIAVEKAGGSGGGGIGGTGLNARYLFFGAKDLMEGRTKFAIAEAANEMMRLQGTALAVGGAVAGVAALGFAAYEVVKGLREIREEPDKIRAAFAKLEEPLRAQGDELRATNAHLEETIAKLRQEPANPLKAALYDVRVEADKLAESLTKDLDKLTELLEKNQVSTWHKILGEAGTSDIKSIIQRLSASQDALMAQFSERMAGTKNPKDVAALQADFSRRLKNLYDDAQQQLKEAKQQAPGIAWMPTILQTVAAGGIPNLVSQDDAARQRTLRESKPNARICSHETVARLRSTHGPNRPKLRPRSKRGPNFRRVSLLFRVQIAVSD